MSLWICLGCDKHKDVMIALKSSTQEGICIDCVSLCVAKIASRERTDRSGQPPKLMLVSVKKGEVA